EVLRSQRSRSIGVRERFVRFDPGSARGGVTTPRELVMPATAQYPRTLTPIEVGAHTIVTRSRRCRRDGAPWPSRTRRSVGQLDEAAERVREPHVLDGPAVDVEELRRAHEIRQAL